MEDKPPSLQERQQREYSFSNKEVHKIFIRRGDGIWSPNHAGADTL